MSEYVTGEITVSFGKGRAPGPEYNCHRCGSEVRMTGLELQAWHVASADQIPKNKILCWPCQDLASAECSLEARLRSRGR